MYDSTGLVVYHTYMYETVATMENHTNVSPPLFYGGTHVVMYVKQYCRECQGAR